MRLVTLNKTINMAGNLMLTIGQMYDTSKEDSTELYNEAIEYISRFQFHGFRLGLERMEAISKALGEPHKNYPTIHVAGSNGKGSVCAFLEAILMETGLKVGLYTSPHLFRLEERFRINKKEIGPDELGEHIFKIRRLIEKGYELSYFEYTTTIAMDWFSKKGVDIAIFETGLGGRLDATNIIHPEISIITNISMEHQAFLGDDIEKIAWEKAGIIKESRPLVCGVRDEKALKVIEERAEALNAKVYLLGRDFDFTPFEGGKMDFSLGERKFLTGLTPALRGSHQMENASLSIMASLLLKDLHGANVTKKAISKGINKAHWPGRGEVIRTRGGAVILDGAHNKAGVLSLLKMLQKDEQFLSAKRRVLLWAMSDEGGDKDFVQLLDMVRGTNKFQSIIITEPPGPRRPVTVEEWQSRIGGSDEVKFVEFKKEWSNALKSALGLLSYDSVLVVSGSLYLVGAVREAIKRRAV